MGQTYFLKCDISGIQKFIFNVPSNGAARALKSRSVYVQTIADNCLQSLNEFFKTDSLRELYNGGGNFYLEVKTDKNETQLNQFIKTIENKYLTKDIFPYIAFVEKQAGNIGNSLNAVNKSIQKSKMQRPVSFDLIDAKPLKVDEVDINTIKGINGQAPNGDFEWIAEKSEGDKKLAALKLDVDNLGALFRDRTEEDYKKLSASLKEFFGEQLLQLIKDLKMSQNIYVVFSGGDDCFLIGSWDKLFKLSIILQQKFEKFQDDLKKQITSLPPAKITFSAGIVVFTPHSPVLQLAEEVEEELNASKRAEGKNSVSVFGKTLSWQDFEKSQKFAQTFAELINTDDPAKKEGKSLLQIFRLIEPTKKEMPKVWQLKYYLRRNVKESNRSVVQNIFNKYEQSLLKKYIGKQEENPDIYLVASRWAEFLMK